MIFHGYVKLPVGRSLRRHFPTWYPWCHRSTVSIWFWRCPMSAFSWNICFKLLHVHARTWLAPKIANRWCACWIFLESIGLLETNIEDERDPPVQGFRNAKWMETTLETWNSELPEKEKLFSHVPRLRTPKAVETAVCSLQTQNKYWAFILLVKGSAAVRSPSLHHSLGEGTCLQRHQIETYRSHVIWIL